MNLEVANRLQQLRKAKGLSQEELANILGLSRQAISKWERAETSPDTDNLICLARLYNISIDKLLDTSESTEEIKERIAQERIKEVTDKDEENEVVESEIFEEKGNEEIISDKETLLNEEQEKTKKTIEKIEGTIYSAAFILGIITWIFIGQIDANSWKWGWVFGAIALSIAVSIEFMFRLQISTAFFGIGLSFLLLYAAFGVCAGFDDNINRVYFYIGVGIIGIQLIIDIIIYCLFFKKNRRTASEVYYKERLIEVKHEYEKKIEKLKNR